MKLRENWNLFFSTGHGSFLFMEFMVTGPGGRFRFSEVDRDDKIISEPICGDTLMGRVIFFLLGSIRTSWLLVQETSKKLL